MPTYCGAACRQVAYRQRHTTRRRRKVCLVCGTAMERQPRGRVRRFCGTACRMAAYRRRQQGMAERTPKWSGPRGRLRLSRLTAFEREQEIEAERQAQHRQHAAPSSHLSLPVTEPKRPPTPAELDAMTDVELLAMVPRKPKPLPDDWMFR